MKGIKSTWTDHALFSLARSYPFVTTIHLPVIACLFRTKDEATDHTTELDFNGQQQRFTHEQAGAAGIAVFNSSVIFEFDW
jgi:hypothetical protein